MQDPQTDLLLERCESVSLAEVLSPAVEIDDQETDRVIDVEFRVIKRSYPVGVLTLEIREPEKPWSPDSRIDRYLAPIRRARQQERLRQLVTSQRQKYPPRWLRIWRSIFCRKI